jgi:microcystin-dependent protein
MGQRTGSERVTLTTNQIPTHNHPFMASSKDANSSTLNGKVFADALPNDQFYTTNVTDKTTLLPQSIQSTGGSQSHNNIMPYLCINFIIALVGTYPSRS